MRRWRCERPTRPTGFIKDGHQELLTDKEYQDYDESGLGRAAYLLDSLTAVARWVPIFPRPYSNHVAPLALKAFGSAASFRQV